MATAPRSTDEILEALNATWNDIDPTIDNQKGPISVLAFGIAAELSRNELMANYLTTVYQLQRANDIDTADLEALGNNYGLDPNVGTQAIVWVTLYRDSRPQPNYIYQAFAGDLVGTDDGRYIFTLLDDVSMNGDTPDLYYNPTEQRYEINVRAQAISVGDDFNLPEGTITALVTGNRDFDGVTNQFSAQKGADPIGPTQFVNIIWSNLQGLNVDMAGRLYSIIYEADPINVTDIKLVGSTEYSLFERLKDTRGRTAYDAYVITDSLTEDRQSYTALGSEPYIDLQMKPAHSVLSVTVDNSPVPFRFQPDTTPSVRQSPLAQDRVYLDGITLQPGQVVSIRYYYFETIYQAWLGIQERVKPFGNDVLVRLGYARQIYIVGRLTTNSAIDRNQVIASVLDFTEDYLRFPDSPSPYQRKFVAVLDPKDYQSSVINTVSGVSNFTVLNFARVDRAVQDVSIIEMDGRTEYPVLSPLSQIL